MKKCVACFLVILLLSGCSEKPEEMELALALRSRLLQASECTFTAHITADYGDRLSNFVMECSADGISSLMFTVTEPSSISGISGKITGKGGQLLFDDTALHFPLITDDQLSPVSAPWIFLNTLRSGYLTSACTEGEQIRLTIDDGYEEDALSLDIWLNGDNDPEHADILHDGRRILSVDVKNFRIL